MQALLLKITKGYLLNERKNTLLGVIHVKEGRTPTDNLKVKPEYEDVKKLAKENN